MAGWLDCGRIAAADEVWGSNTNLRIWDVSDRNVEMVLPVCRSIWCNLVDRCASLAKAQLSSNICYPKAKN